MKAQSLFDIYRQLDGALSHKWRHYFEIYERYFAKFVGKYVTFLEIGVQDGGSLHMWRKYFGEQATIIGVDISPDCKKLEKDGFIIEIGDMGDIDFLRELKRKIGNVDVILDDGSHIPKHQILALNELFPIVSEGGIYLCEDVYNSYLYMAESFVDYSKGLIDELHGWWDTDIVGQNFFPTKLTKTCGGIFFHDGIIAFDKAIQEERFDLISGNFSTAPPAGKPYPEGPYITQDLFKSLSPNPDGTISLHRAPTPNHEKLPLKNLPSIGDLLKHRTEKTLYISTQDPSSWVLCWGPDFSVVDDGMLVDGFIRSKACFPAQAGKRYKCEFFVRVSSEPTNDLPLTYSVGPIALSQTGSVCQYPALQEALSPGTGFHRGEVMLEAAPDAVEIYVGIQGPSGDPRVDSLPVFAFVSLTIMD